jgi:hypothetical protein
MADDTKQSDDLKKRHDKALAKFQLSANYFSKQREREVRALKFVDFGEQWEPTAKAARSGQPGGGAGQGIPPTPARPTPVINQLRAPGAQIASARRAAKLALEFAPKGSGSNTDVAEVFEDIVRGVQAESRANIARNWAADRSDKAGLGWFRIDKQYCLDNPAPDDPAINDQDIVYRRILNQASVYPDPNAQEPDFSDGKILFVTEDLPWDTYVDTYGADSLLDEGGEDEGAELTAIGDKLPLWVFASTSAGADDDEGGSVGKTIRIAECWEVVETMSDMDMGDGRTRKIRTRKVFWSKMNAKRYLDEPQEWDGSYIPIIPTVAEEYNVNGERRWSGYVEPAIDAAMSYNVMRAGMISAVAMSTRAPYIGYMETIEPFLDWWKQSATRDFFILPIKAAKAPDGSLLPPPQRTMQGADLQGFAIAAQAAKEDVHSTTLVPPAALGELDPHDRSGKAIMALQGQSEAGIGGYLDNIVSITIPYEGMVLRDLIPRVYDRPGRIVPAVNDADQKRMVMLNHPFIVGEDGNPQPVQGWTEGMPLPPNAQMFDLRKGEYSIQPVVGKSFPTRREAVAATIQQMMSSVPPEMAMGLLPALLENLDVPEAKRLSALAKKLLPPPLQQAYEENPGEMDPARAQAMIQQLTQQLQQAHQMIATKTAEVQARGQIDLQKTQLQEQADSQRTAVEQQARIQVAEIAANAGIAEADIKSQNQDLDRRLRLIELFLTAKQEARLDSEAHLHDHVQQVREQIHEVGMSNLEHQQAIEQARVGHQNALEQGQQQAALTPQPETGAGA